MPSVQSQFEDFHSAIKLDSDDEKATLRTKRQILIDALYARLGDDVPKFETFNQGSYAMHTGVVPLDGNYDIDVGVIFDCDENKYPDPVELKKKVRDALSTNNRNVLIRRPCVTVNYIRGEITDYHVDLVLYCARPDGKLAIGKGRENSEPEFRFWEIADPKELTKLICEAFVDSADLAQYRRCVRYLKRWRDVQFSNGGAPLSIALTVAAMKWFQPNFEGGKAQDLLALLDWVNVMLENFAEVYDDGRYDRLSVYLPVEPGGDLMERLSKNQMENFHLKLQKLRDVLKEAYYEDLPEDACKLLTKQFGDDFKIPEKTATAKQTVSPVISTGSSA